MNPRQLGAVIAVVAAGLGQVTKAEKGLIWLLVHRPQSALPALGLLDGMDLINLTSRSVLDLAQKLNEDKGFSPAALMDGLSAVDAGLVTAIAAESEPHAHDATDCARILKRLRYERERTELQREIDRAQNDGETLDALLVRKRALIAKLEDLA